MKKLAPIKSPTQKVDLRALPPTQVKVADRGKGLQLYIPPDLYKALKAAKKLITYESELLAHVLRGQRLREDSPSGTNQPT